MRVTSRRRRQAGQATMAASLATMVLVFSFAGALASGFSSLLSQAHTSRANVSRDVDINNEITAMLAQEATDRAHVFNSSTGQWRNCDGTVSPSSTGTYSHAIPYTYGYPQAWCLPVGDVTLGATSPTAVWFNRSKCSAGTEFATLPQGTYSFWLNFRGFGPQVYVDQNPGTCFGSMSSMSTDCQQVGSPVANGPIQVDQYAFKCTPDSSTDPGFTIHVQADSVADLPLTARYAAPDSSGGLLYTIVAPVKGPATGRIAAEEADMWVDYGAQGNEPPVVLTWEHDL